MLKMPPFLSLKWCFSLQKERFKKIWESWEGKSISFFWISNVRVGLFMPRWNGFFAMGIWGGKYRFLAWGWVGQGGFCFSTANSWNIIHSNPNCYEESVGCYAIEFISLYTTLSSLISALQSNNDNLQIPLGTPLEIQGRQKSWQPFFVVKI